MRGRTIEVNAPVPRAQHSCIVEFLIDGVPQKDSALEGVISRQWALKILNTLKRFKFTGTIYWQWQAPKKIIRGLRWHKFLKQVYSDSESSTELNKINILIYTEEYQRKALTIRDRIKRLAEKRSINNQYKARCERNMDADQLHITFLYGSPFYSRELSKANSQATTHNDLKYPVRHLRVLNAMTDVLSNSKKSIRLDFEEFNQNSLRRGLRARAAWSRIDGTYQSLRGNDILFCVLFGQEVEQEFDKKQAKRKMFFGENKFGGLQLISAEFNRSGGSSSEIKMLLVQTNCMEAARQMFHGCAKNIIYVHSNVLQEDEAAERFTRVFFESLILKAMTEFEAFEEARTQASRCPSPHMRCLRFRKPNSMRSCPYPLYYYLGNCCREVEGGDQDKEPFQVREKFEGYFYGPARKLRPEKGNLQFDADLREAIKKAEEVGYEELQLGNRIQTAKVFYERKKLMQSNIRRLSVNVNGRQGSGKAYLKDYLLNCMRIKQMIPRDPQAICSEKYGSMSPAEAEWLSKANVGFLVWDHRHLRGGSLLQTERAESLVNGGKYSLLVVSTGKLCSSNIDIECKPPGDGIMLERKDLPLGEEVGEKLSKLVEEAKQGNSLIIAHLKGLQQIEGLPVPNPQEQILLDATAHNPCSMFSVWLESTKPAESIPQNERDVLSIGGLYTLIRNAASDFVQTANLPEQLVELVCLVINVKLMSRSMQGDFELILQSIQESLGWALAATLSAYSAQTGPQEEYPTTKVELLAIVSELLLQVRLERLLLSCSHSQAEQKKLERTHELMSAIKRSLRRQIQQEETLRYKVLLVALSFSQHLAYQLELFAQQGSSTTQRHQRYLKELQQAAYYCKIGSKLSDAFLKLGMLADQLRSPQRLGAPEDKSRLGLIIQLLAGMGSLANQQKLAQKLNNLAEVSKLFEARCCLQAKFKPVEDEDNKLSPADRRPIWRLLRRKLSEAREVLNGLIAEQPIFTLVVAAQQNQLPSDFESRFTLDKNNIQIEMVSANFSGSSIPWLMQRGSQYYCIWYGKWEADAAADTRFLQTIINLGKNYQNSKVVFVCNRWIDPTAWPNLLAASQRKYENSNWPVVVNLSKQHQYRDSSNDYQGQLLIQSIVEYLVRNIQNHKSGNACMPELIQTFIGTLTKSTWAAFATDSQLDHGILADFLSCFRMFVPYDQEPIGISDSARWLKSRGTHQAKAHSQLLASPRLPILSSGKWGVLNPAHQRCATFAAASRQEQDTLVGDVKLVCSRRQWYEDGLIQIDCRGYERKLIGNMEYEAVQFVEDELGYQLPELEYKNALLILKGVGSLIRSRTYPRLRRLLERTKTIRILFIGEQALLPESFARDKLELADIKVIHSPDIGLHSPTC